MDDPNALIECNGVLLHPERATFDEEWRQAARRQYDREERRRQLSDDELFRHLAHCKKPFGCWICDA